MSDKRQKSQLELAFAEEGRSEAPKASQEGTESLTAKCVTERPASHGQLMEEICQRENCWQAYKRVKANKGSPGIDAPTDSPQLARTTAGSSDGPWHRADSPALHYALPNTQFDSLGLPRLYDGHA